MCPTLNNVPSRHIKMVKVSSLIMVSMQLAFPSSLFLSHNTAQHVVWLLVMHKTGSGATIMSVQCSVSKLWICRQLYTGNLEKQKFKCFLLAKNSTKKYNFTLKNTVIHLHFEDLILNLLELLVVLFLLLQLSLTIEYSGWGTFP